MKNYQIALVMALIGITNSGLIKASRVTQKLTFEGRGKLIQQIKDGEFIEGDLRGVRLMGAGLYGVNLTGADLTYAILTGTNLSSSSLIDATLTNVNLTGARLVGADLTLARLEGAILIGADLTNVINLSTARFSADTNVQGAIGLSLEDKCYLHRYNVQNIPWGPNESPARCSRPE